MTLSGARATRGIALPAIADEVGAGVWSNRNMINRTRRELMAFTVRSLKDLPDSGSNFDGPPDLEFRHASAALGLERSGLSYQRVPPGYRFGTWRGYEAGPQASRSSSSVLPVSASMCAKTWRGSATGGLISSDFQIANRRLVWCRGS
jgi:hypothetical protein